LANTAPILAPIANRTVVAGNTVIITNSATDGEAPPQILTYSLISPPVPPGGASINSSNGLFSWRPTIVQGGTTHLLNVQVSDSGSPSLRATQSFSVTVNRPLQPVLNSAAISNGQFRLLISGQAGPDYTIQGSTNLVDWTQVWTTNPPTLPFLFSDPSASNFSRRFYRVLLGP
jgi:hypothetical protein